MSTHTFTVTVEGGQRVAWIRKRDPRPAGEVKSASKHLAPHWNLDRDAVNGNGLAMPPPVRQDAAGSLSPVDTAGLFPEFTADPILTRTPARLYETKPREFAEYASAPRSQRDPPATQTGNRARRAIALQPN